MLLSTTQQARASSLPLTDMNVAGCVVPFTGTVRPSRYIYWAWQQTVTTFDKHVQNVFKLTSDHIRVTNQNRSSLTTDMAKIAACALVNSRLDYVNSVIYGTRAANTSKLQRVQNYLARVDTHTKQVQHIHPALQNAYSGCLSTTVSTTRERHWSVSNTVNRQSGLLTSCS
jgi:hypothetical protein